MRDWFIPVGSVRRDLCWSVRRVTEVFLDGGPRAVHRRIRHRLHLRHQIHDILPRAPGTDVPSLNIQFKVWLQQHQLQADDIELMRREIETFTYNPIARSSPSLCPSITPTKSDYAELYNLCGSVLPKLGDVYRHRCANRFQGGWQTSESGLGPGKKTSRITSSGLPDAGGFKRASTPRARDVRLVSQGSLFVGCSKM
jgi:hypothetical protein